MILVEPRCQKEKKKTMVLQSCATGKSIQRILINCLFLMNFYLSIILTFLFTISVFYFPSDYLRHTETPVSL